MSIPLYFWFPALGSTLFGTFFMNIPPVADQFMGVFGVGYAGLSFFLSAVYWTHSLFQVPGGLVVDRLGVTRSLLICLTVMITVNLIPFLAPHNLTLAVAMRLVLGLVTGAAFLSLVKIIKILTPPNHIARMQGIQGATFCLGTLVPYWYLPLAGQHGWAASYLSEVLFCIVMVLCLFALPRGRLNEPRRTETFPQVMRSLKKIFMSHNIWRIGVCHGFFFSTINTFGNWLPSILADVRASSTPEDWAVATSVMLLVGTAGRVFGAEIIGRMTRWQLISRTMFVIGVTYWILAFCPNATVFFCLCVALALLCGLTFASVFTLLIDISRSSYLSTSMGCVNMIANGVNIVFILLWGAVREQTGSFAPGLCVTGACALAAWLWARRKDPEKYPETDEAV